MTGLDESAVDRMRMAWLFGLTGGELNDEPWAGYRYNYDGVPEYATTDFPDRWQHRFRTIIGSFLFTEPNERLEDDEGEWERAAVYASSGEAECPFRPGLVQEGRCILCEEPRGEEHGYIYVGDGWAEVVYRLSEPDG